MHSVIKQVLDCDTESFIFRAIYLGEFNMSMYISAYVRKFMLVFHSIKL